MPVPNSNVDQLTAITNKHFIPTLPDLVFDANTVLGKIPKENAPGGEKIAQPLMYQFTKDGAYFDYAKGSTDAEDQITQAEYNWKNYRQRIVISIPEMRRNSGPEGVFNLLKTKVKGAGTAIRDAIATDWYEESNGDASAGVNSIFNVLGDGSIASNLTGASDTSGGINKNTATNAFFRGKSQDDAANAIGLPATMHSLWFQLVDGGFAPNLIVSHPNGHLNHWTDSTYGGGQLQRFVNTNAVKQGFETLSFMGQPWITDRRMVSTVTASSGHLLMLDLEFMRMVQMRGETFRFSGFMTPVNQNVQIGWIYWMGNIMSSDPSRSGFTYS